MKAKLKKYMWPLIGLAAVVLLGIGGGVWYYIGHNSSDPVYVYDFDMVGMTEYWGDNKESYGPVSTDSIQTIFLSNTQTVTEVNVQEGDTVKKGDLLMTFDTTLSDLALEKARLEVEKQKLQLIEDQNRLAEIKSMRPMVIPVVDPNAKEDLGSELTEAYRLSGQTEYDGSSVEKAMVCWIRSDTAVEGGLLEAIRARSEEYYNKNQEQKFKEEQAAAAPSEGAEGETPAEPAEYTPVSVTRFYVIFKQTQQNMSLGTPGTWQGVLVDTASGNLYFFDASGNMDYTLSEEERPDRPEIDFGSGFTAAQIAEMRREQEKKIMETEFQIKMAEADYKIMLTEVTDGRVLAQFDGRVASLVSEDEAKTQGVPFMKVSGGGGFRIEGSVSELDRDELAIGTEVTIMDYRNGGSYTGTVQSIGEYPTNAGGYYGNGNPNSSYYPFTVFVDESADLVAGNYVDIQFSLTSSSNGVYLENPFLRKENGSAFVYVRGENGKLERREVVTGKSLWGSYTEIVQGLSAEDKVAFPYGKAVKPGAATAPGDYSTLYEQ